MAHAAAGSSATAAPKSLFEGVDAAVCVVLGIGSLEHRSALYELGGRTEIPRGSVAAALDMIASNWMRASRAGVGSVSQENWRWCVPQTSIGVKNKSPEVMLERAIAGASVGAGRDAWANQVPIASGIVGPTAERRRAIDLVHKVAEGRFEFIELKIASDTPLYAAFEIIGYAGVWLLSRQDPCGKQLLEAKQIDLRVLAPAAYYRSYNLSRIELAVDEELQEYAARRGTKMTFGFDVLPESLGLPCGAQNEELLALLDSRRPL